MKVTIKIKIKMDNLVVDMATQHILLDEHWKSQNLVGKRPQFLCAFKANKAICMDHHHDHELWVDPIRFVLFHF